MTSSLSGRVRGHQSVMYFYYSVPALLGVPMGAWGHLTAFLINILSVYNPAHLPPTCASTHTHKLTSLIFCGCVHFSTGQCPLHCLCLPPLVSRPNLKRSFFISHASFPTSFPRLSLSKVCSQSNYMPCHAM